MLSKQHAISISVCIIFSALIPVSPAFSQDTPAHFTLQLLHAADLEGGVEALENAPRFSSVLNALKAEEENTVIIGAGDTYIPGAFFAAGNDPSLRDVLGREGSGRADILMLNAMGFMASALGNHEFDLGTSAIAGLIQADGIGYVGTAFPFLSANLDFSLDSALAPLAVDAGQEASTIPNVSARARSSPPLQAKKSVLSVQRRHGSEPYHRRVMSELCPRTGKIFRGWR